MMYPRGYYYYAMQNLNKPMEDKSDGQAKAVVQSEQPNLEVGMFLRLGAVMVVIVAAVAVVTSLAG
jgi:hypothetical protein